MRFSPLRRRNRLCLLRLNRRSIAPFAMSPNRLSCRPIAEAATSRFPMFFEYSLGFALLRFLNLFTERR